MKPGRLDIFRSWPAGYTAMQGLEQALLQAEIDPTLLELVRVRASLLNRCGFCLDFHAQTALGLGTDPMRVIRLEVWPEASCYTDPERAALALTDALTTPSHGVSDDTLDTVRSYFSPAQTAQLVYAVATINAWNRLAIADRTPTT